MRKNSMRTGGPRTPLGKSRSSRNSRKLGIFAKEFKLSAQEQSEFEETRNWFQEGLQPNTPLEEVVFEDVVACWWRMKLSLRGEQLQLRKEFNEENRERDARPSDEEVPLHFPYPMSAWEIKKRLQLIDAMEGTVKQNQEFGSDMASSVRLAFGEDFLNLLQECIPMSPALLMISETIEKKSELLRMKLKFPNPTAEDEQAYRLAHASLAWNMRLKLVQLEKQHLRLALYHAEQGRAGFSGPISSDRLDLFLRYATNARREFYRTLNYYLKIKGKLG